MGNFYKLRTCSEISEEVSLQSMIFLSVKYMGFCAFFSDEYFLSQNPLNDNTGCYYGDMGFKKEKRLPGNMVISVFMSQRKRC